MLAELVHSQNKFCVLSSPYSYTSLGGTTTKLPTTKQAEEKSGCDRRYVYIITWHWYIKNNFMSRVKSLTKCQCRNTITITDTREVSNWGARVTGQKLHTNKRKTSKCSLPLQASFSSTNLPLPLKYQSAVLPSILIPLCKEICVSLPQIRNMRRLTGP